MAFSNLIVTVPAHGSRRRVVHSTTKSSPKCSLKRVGFQKRSGVRGNTSKVVVKRSRTPLVPPRPPHNTNDYLMSLRDCNTENSVSFANFSDLTLGWTIDPFGSFLSTSCVDSSITAGSCLSSSSSSSSVSPISSSSSSSNFCAFDSVIDARS